MSLAAGPAPGGGVRDGINSEARDRGAPACPSRGRFGLPAPHGALPDLPPPPAAGHGIGADIRHGWRQERRHGHRAGAGERARTADRDTASGATGRWQGLGSVTGVTEPNREAGGLTPFIQRINFICAIALTSEPLRTHPLHPVHTARTGSRRPPLGAQKRSRWTRRSPARSTTYPCCEGMAPVGAGACRVELCEGYDRVGGLRRALVVDLVALVEPK
jgi:hypothetical protein